MKNYFSFFKSRALSYLAIALVFVTIPLSAEERCCTCCCVPVSQCASTQEKCSADSYLDQNTGKGTKEFQLEAEELIRGPGQILFCLPIGLFWGFVNVAKHEDSLLESIYYLPFSVPICTADTIICGVIRTLTLGKFKNNDLIFNLTGMDYSF